MLLLIILVPLGFAVLALLHFHFNTRARAAVITQPRSIGFFASTTSLVASAAGVWILFSPAQAASWSGLYGLFGYALGQAAPFILIAIIGTRLLKTLPRGYTLPQWAQARYGPAAGLWALLISIFYMGIFLAAELTAIGFAASLISDVPLPLTVAFIAFCTWLYTNRGGFGSVLWTDKIQFALLVPLLLLIFVVTLFFMAPRIPASESILPAQSLFPSFGLEFGIVLFIAILAAQVFNQSIWQRAYACRNAMVMRTSFLSAGLLMIPIILIAGAFGLFALRLDLVSSTEETELFLVVMELAPQWILILLLLVALILVMSSIDSLLNALAEALSSFVIQRPDGLSTYLQKQDGVQRMTRIFTSALALATAIVAMQGYSVLYLFLVADLICAGAVVPLFYGLYNKHLTQGGMLLSSIFGILGGGLLMLSPSFQPLFPQVANPVLCFVTGAAAGCENSPNFALLMSFLSALVLSTIATVACAYIKATKPDVRLKIKK